MTSLSVGALEHRGGNVGHLGARRNRRGRHALKHLRGHDDRLAAMAGGAQKLLLQAGHLLQRQLDAEVAPGNHNAVGQVEDVSHGIAAGRAHLDLRHDPARPWTIAFTSRMSWARCTKETAIQSTPASRAASQSSWSLVVSEPSGRIASGRLTLRLDRMPPVTVTATRRPGVTDKIRKFAIVDQKRVAGFRRRVNFGVQEADALRVSGGVICVEHDALAALKPDLALGERADAKFRALQIGQNRDGAVSPTSSRRDAT